MDSIFLLCPQYVGSVSLPIALWVFCFADNRVVGVRDRILSLQESLAFLRLFFARVVVVVDAFVFAYILCLLSVLMFPGSAHCPRGKPCL